VAWGLSTSGHLVKWKDDVAEEQNEKWWWYDEKEK
jgi:hypothetical protein